VARADPMVSPISRSARGSALAYDALVASKGSDEQILDEFFQATTPKLEEMVGRAIAQAGRADGLAVTLERKFDGEVAGGCGPRRALEGRLRGVQGIDEAARRRILAEVGQAAADEIPVVLLVHAEGFVSVGIRRLRGSWVGVS
jgi:hypothetical protein